MAVTHMLLALVLAPLAPQAAGTEVAAQASANPVRRVVTMLQSMEKQVAEEGVKEKTVFDEAMCYCKSTGASLAESISSNTAKIAELKAGIAKGDSEKEQLIAELGQSTADRTTAVNVVGKANSLREKEAAQFATNDQNLKQNIAALAKAIAAIAKGTGASFVQTGEGQLVKNLVVAQKDMLDTDRRDILAFLSGTQGGEYAPQSGEITGILKQLQDDMAKALADAQAAEATAVQEHAALTAAKKKEITALTMSIEQKMERKGALGVQLAEMRGELDDTTQALEENRRFLAELEKDCAAKRAEWDERSKMRAEELVAIAETIKILNSDDALELFKKTLPAPAASFLQVQGATSRTLRTRALSMIRQARGHTANLDFLALALQGKTKGFAAVIAMIDEMSAMLASDQTADDTKKAQCAGNLAGAADEKKRLDRAKSELGSTVEEAQQTMDQVVADIAALKKGIADLDKSVAEATAIRKEEHKDFTDMMAANAAAKQLINMAKNRMNKFYNRRLYKEAKREELSAMGRIHETHMSFTQLSEATKSDYPKKHEGSNSVIAMMDLLIAELDKEMTEAKADENNAQELYEKMLKDAQQKRAHDAASIGERQSAKADLAGRLQTHAEGGLSLEKDIQAAAAHARALHDECDWLLQNFDVRKEARAAEKDALKRAKDVLSGADYA